MKEPKWTKLEDEEYKKKPESMLLWLKHTKLSHTTPHMKAVYELRRREQEKEEKNIRLQRGIRRMTLAILLFTLALLVIALLQLFTG